MDTQWDIEEIAKRPMYLLDANGRNKIRLLNADYWLSRLRRLRECRVRAMNRLQELCNECDYMSYPWPNDWHCILKAEFECRNERLRMIHEAQVALLDKIIKEMEK
jgi:hypothetical protein